jgi:hypothetical protein
MIVPTGEPGAGFSGLLKYSLIVTVTLSSRGHRPRYLKTKRDWRNLQNVADPRNHPLLHKAGTQDSGLFFCTSYENSVVVFLKSPQNRGDSKPDSHRAVLVFSCSQVY